MFHSWSAQALIDPLPIAAGEGSTFWDYQGNAYLDFSSQLVNLNLGHQHPDLVAAIQQQAGRLATIQPSMANDVRGELARRIAEVAPGDLDKVFFTNGGADANEYAVRMARTVTGRRKVLSMYRSYHGGTATAISLTGDPRRWANEPSDGSVAHFLGPYPYRSSFHADSPEQEAERALAHLEQVITLEGAGTIAAIILETVVGTNGVLVPPPGYLQGVRELCDRYGIVYIADEVMVGFGRVGEWFAVNHFGVVPDLITFAKGVNSGYVPLGGVVISQRIASHFDTVAFQGGLTYSGHPLACAAGVATFEVFEREGILERVRDLGSRVVEPRLRAMAAAHPSVGEVRGLGLFWAIELVKNRHDPRAAGSVQCERCGCRSHGRGRSGLQAGRAVAVHPLQPHARRPAARDHRGRARAAGSTSSMRRSPWPTGTSPRSARGVERTRPGHRETPRCPGLVAEYHGRNPRDLRVRRLPDPPGEGSWTTASPPIGSRTSPPRQPFQLLYEFLPLSGYQQRRQEPGVLDFTFGDPHDPPSEAYVEILREALIPQHELWFAYNFGDAKAIEAATESLRRHIDLPFEPDDVHPHDGRVHGDLDRAQDRRRSWATRWSTACRRGSSTSRLVLEAGLVPVKVSIDRRDASTSTSTRSRPRSRRARAS